MDNFVLTNTSESFAKAVAERFNQIRHNFSERDGDYAYGGNRTAAKNLGWRVSQNHGEIAPEDVMDGKFDAEIEATWHEAASAEHWYRYEKEWY